MTRSKLWERAKVTETKSLRRILSSYLPHLVFEHVPVQVLPGRGCVVADRAHVRGRAALGVAQALVAPQLGGPLAAEVALRAREALLGLVHEHVRLDLRGALRGEVAAGEGAPEGTRRFVQTKG